MKRKGFVEARKMKEAAEKIGLSYRRTKRIRERMKEGIKAKVLKLSQKVYGEFSDQRFTEKLDDGEGIEVSRETVRKIQRGAGIGPKRKRRGKKHASVGTAKPRRGGGPFGMGAPYPWFGPDLPACCWMAAIDDATGRMPAARFFPSTGPKAISGCCGRSCPNMGFPFSPLDGKWDRGD